MIAGAGPSPREPYLPDYLAMNLDLIFVGAAASLRAAEAGHYYAGFSNRFWLLLHQAGFTPRELHSSEDALLLSYRIGLTGIFKYLSTSANHLLPPATEEHRAALREKLLACRPLVVCYNGRDVYEMATGQKCARWGEQQEMLGGSLLFVAISSSGRADRWGMERLEQYKELRALVEHVKARGA